MITPHPRRRRPAVSITLDFTSSLADRAPDMAPGERSKLTEPVALLVELGEQVTPAVVRQLALELRGRQQFQAIVTRRGRGGRRLVRVMPADVLCAYAAECHQDARLQRLERSLRKPA
ncbi:hypothetical protein ABT354_11325 [Streptomyces sp. NPDC000594]|uniref:hypothetical protein n=1 Tax=Streptomyces sp. NPDC000594 TaxID=3154261 RepID=UPI00331F7F5D